MNNNARPHRWPWALGVMLLAVSAVGAGFAFNNGGGGGGGGAGDDAAPPAVLAIGLIDVEPGVANLYPVQQGPIEWVVKEGTEVKKGDPLLKLDARKIEEKVKQAREARDDAKTQLEKAKLLPEEHELKVKMQEQAINAAEGLRDAKVAERDARMDTLSKFVLQGMNAEIKVLTANHEAEKLKLKQLNLYDPKLDVNRAKADVAAKEAQLKLAELTLEDCTLRAPMNGSVLRVMVQTGETLGDNPKLPAIQFLPAGPRVVRAEVLQEWATRVKAGQSVVIEDDTSAGTKYEGEVTRVSDWFTHKRSIMIEPFMVNDVRTLECIVRINSKADFKIGQRVRVRIKTG